METTKIELARLRNEEHFQFQTEFTDLVTETGAEALNIETQFTAYQPLYAQENEALQVIRKSATTKELADADTDRDTLYRGLADAVNSGLNHFNADKRAASARLKIVFDQYGNVARKTYDEETAAITKLVQEATGTYSADVATSGLADWVIELDAKNKAFDALMKSRYSEEAGKTELRMKSVRLDIDAAYRDIINRLDALMLINGSANYEAFVRELNTRVEKYNNIIAQRKGRNAKDNDDNKNTDGK